MNDFINIINIIVILIFVLTYYCIYKKSSYVFGLLFLPFSFWIQLLISSAYIETETYLVDFLQYSYATGATIRLFLLLEIQMIIFLFNSKRIENRLKNIEEVKSNNKNIYRICYVCLIMALYLLVDVIIYKSTNRFTYYIRTNSLPFINIISYFSYVITFIMGYIFSKYKNRKIYLLTISFLGITFLWLYLRGVQFGGYMITMIMFLTCTIINLCKKQKLIRIRYIVIGVVVLLVILIPKYNFFTKTSLYGSMGLNSAYEKMIYRAFSQGADLTWVIDKQIVKENQKDYGQFFNELKSFINNDEERNSGVYYLMRRACPNVVLKRYFSGTAAITGGYPIIWVAILGYYLGIIPIIIEALLFIYLLYKIALAIKEENFIMLIMLIFIYSQCYSIIMSSGIFYLGNIIPKVFLGILIILDLIHKPIVFKGKRIV